MNTDELERVIRYRRAWKPTFGYNSVPKGEFSPYPRVEPRVKFQPDSTYPVPDDLHDWDLHWSVLFWGLDCIKTRFTPKTLQLVNVRNYVPGELFMAKRAEKRADTPDVGKGTGVFRGFVNVELTDDDWSKIDAVMAAKNPNMTPAIAYLVEHGKVSISFQRGSFNVTLISNSGANDGIAVSSFSDNLIEAVLITAYKHQTYGSEFVAMFADGTRSKRSRG